MTYFIERRKYQRCASAMCKTLMSMDGLRWSEIDVQDISAGGLRFASRSDYELNTRLYLNICVFNLLSEFNMRFDGRLIRKERDKDVYVYSVKFINVNKYHQIQLDELIRSKISVKTNSHASDDGMYAFLFMPRIKGGGIKLFKGK